MRMILVQLPSLSKLDQWLRALCSLATIHFGLRISDFRARLPGNNRL
jgi:hypothetical protein